MTRWVSGPTNLSIDDDLLGIDVEPLFKAIWIVILIVRQGIQWNELEAQRAIENDVFRPNFDD